MSADMRRYIKFGGYGIRAAQSRYFYSAPPICEAQQNLTELIIQDFAVDASSKVFSGDYVAIRPHKCMSHDNTWPIVQKFQNIGVKKVFDPKQLVYTLDHDVQNRSEANIKKYTNIEKFAKQQNVDFYPAGRGIGHQIMIEEGYALPMTFTVASDSHSNMYGGIGCLGTPIVRTDAASIWATGQTWWQIPPVAKVNLTGQLPLGVTGKDLIITLCGLFNNDEVLNHAIEFTGPGVSQMEIDDRLTIANMTTEWGALSGLFPVDEKLLNWYLARIKRLGENHLRINHDLIRKLEKTVANPFDTANAKYAKVLNLNLSDLVPNVAGPNSVKITASVDKLEPQRIKINKAYLVSCTNSRLSDLKAAAKVLQNKTINPTVQFFLAAASCEVQKDAEECGAWDTLIKAGCTPLPAGCGPCIGLGTGLLEDGEVGISATNRNFKGRMGSRNALAYLASPAVVAASALEGYICGPKDSMDEARHSTIEHSIENKNIVSKDGISSNTKKTTTTATAILKGFPEQIKGEILFCDYDNMNTDGIYPGKYTYQDDVSRDQMSRVVMENYDKSFSAIAKEGDVLVSGFNFGCGSSREQAATALLSKNIPLVIAGSFSDIFKRNSINNGLLCIEAPELIHKLRAATESHKLSKGLTVRTGWQVEWDIARNTLKITTDNELDSFKIDTGSLGVSVQELYLYGGIENWIKAKSQAI